MRIFRKPAGEVRKAIARDEGAYAGGVTADQTAEVLLLVDTCGERGSVALVRGDEVVGELTLPERAASAGLLGAVREVLAAGRVALPELSAVGVVNGPGSFTGVRVGLAVCKGFCEAAGLRMAAVSRLEVLADAAGLREGLAVLRAGRDQVYARAAREGVGDRCERLLDVRAMAEQVGEGELVYAESALLPLLQNVAADARYVEFAARDALRPVRRCLAEGGSDLAMVDANYGRDEGAIYARKQGSR